MIEAKMFFFHHHNNALISHNLKVYFYNIPLCSVTKGLDLSMPKCAKCMFLMFIKARIHKTFFCFLATKTQKPNNASKKEYPSKKRVFINQVIEDGYKENKEENQSKAASKGNSIPVRIRHRFDVYTTSITLKRRRLDVKTTLCVYWENKCCARLGL